MKSIKNFIMRKLNTGISGLNNIKISRKITLFFAILVGIPVIFLNFVFVIQISKTYKQQLVRLSQNNLQRIVDDIDYKFEKYNALLNALSVNTVVQDALYRNEKGLELDRNSVNRQISHEFQNTIIANSIPEITQVTLYVNDERFPVNGDATMWVGSIKNRLWKEAIISGESIFLENDNIFLVKKVYSTNLSQKNREYGYIMFQLDIPTLFRFEISTDSEEETTTIVLKGNKIIYSSKKADNIVPVDMPEVEFGEYREFTRGDFVTTYTRDKRGWTILSVHENSELNNDLTNVYGLTIILNILLLIVIIFGTRIFGRTFTKRLLQISRKMNSFTDWKSQDFEEVDGSDEIAQIDKSFMCMVKKNNQLINEIYVNELEKKEIQLRALQLQINPHFLYNTLETINGIALAKDCEPIPDIVQNLGDMFRYNTDVKTDIVSFSQEINHIKKYLEIQKIRYGEKLEVYYDIEDAAYECMIVKFVLQPIVENALCHGIDKNGSKGVIEISARCADEKLFIHIFDDGNGMNEEGLKKIRQLLQTDDSIADVVKKRSVGMCNVNKRIKLHYGEDYGISVESKEKVGTKVTLTFPIETIKKEVS